MASNKDLRLPDDRKVRTILDWKWASNLHRITSSGSGATEAKRKDQEAAFYPRLEIRPAQIRLSKQLHFPRFSSNFSPVSHLFVVEIFAALRERLQPPIAHTFPNIRLPGAQSWEHKSARQREKNERRATSHRKALTRPSAFVWPERKTARMSAGHLGRLSRKTAEDRK